MLADLIEQRKQVGWRLWLYWTLTGALVAALGGAVALVAERAGVGAVGLAKLAAVALAVVAMAQWLVLCRRVPRPGWWVLAGAVGLASALVLVLPAAFADSYDMLLTVALPLLGVGQWLVLRRLGSPSPAAGS